MFWPPRASSGAGPRASDRRSSSDHHEAEPVAAPAASNWAPEGSTQFHWQQTNGQVETCSPTTEPPPSRVWRPPSPIRPAPAAAATATAQSVLILMFVSPPSLEAPSGLQRRLGGELEVSGAAGAKKANTTTTNSIFDGRHFRRRAAKRRLGSVPAATWQGRPGPARPRRALLRGPGRRRLAGGPRPLITRPARRRPELAARRLRPPGAEQIFGQPAPSQGPTSGRRAASRVYPDAQARLANQFGPSSRRAIVVLLPFLPPSLPPGWGP